MLASSAGQCSLDDDEAQYSVSFTMLKSLTFSHSRSPGVDMGDEEVQSQKLDSFS